MSPYNLLSQFIINFASRILANAYKQKSLANLQSFKFFVPRQGFEPQHSDPESDVLPLYYRGIGR
jgi:hypothetical protein